MPLREFACENCGSFREIYHQATDPGAVPAPLCRCGALTFMVWSLPNIDTSSTFHSFDYKGPDGRQFHINNLHDLRKVEHSYLESGHNIRFDAYSADPSNPDETDGFGLEYWDGKQTSTSGKAFNFARMENK